MGHHRFSDARAALLDELAEHIADAGVLAAIGAVDRARFLPRSVRGHAHENVSLPIAGGQTISQPFVVARMLELLALTGVERALDVGTGSGYHAALLHRLAGAVLTIERDGSLSAAAQTALAEVGAGRVTCIVGDGWQGYAPGAPYDAINVAATPGDHAPAALLDQLAPGGRLVAPLGPRGGRAQVLTRITRRADGRLGRPERFEQVRFVPLVPGGGARRRPRDDRA